MLREEHIKYYDGTVTLTDDGEATLCLDERNGKPINENIPVNLFMGVDPASSTKKTADYSTIVTVAIDSDNNRYVLPYYRKHATPMNLANSILEYFKIYKPSKTRIESVGYQEMLREYLRDRCDEEKLFIPGLEIRENPRTSKSNRLETLEPYFAQGKVFIKKDMEELKNELLLFPRGKHDDLLDGLYYSMKRIYTPNHEVKQDKNEKKSTSYLQYDWMTA